MSLLNKTLVSRPEKPLERTYSEREGLLTQAVEHYHGILTNGDEKGKTYLKKRGLYDEGLIKTFKIGYSDGRAKEPFKAIRIPMREKLGLFKQNYMEVFANCLTFPVLNSQGYPVAIYGRRSMEYSNRSLHCFTTNNPDYVFNIQNLLNSETIIITKSILDALSIYKSGFRNVTCLGEGYRFSDSLKVLCQKGEVQNIILALKSTPDLQTLTHTITRNLPHKQVVSLNFPAHVKDANDFFFNCGEKAIQKAIQEVLDTKPLLSIVIPFIPPAEPKYSEKKLESFPPEPPLESFPEENIQSNFLKSPNLIQEIISDITRLGYAGEDDNKLLVYLSATSRKLNNPVSVLIRSRSSTGKSYLMEKISELMPEEDVNQWSMLTPRALFYMPKDGLKHKLIVIDERAGMQKAEYPIRTLQSMGKLSIAVPIKDPKTGEIETKNIIKEGPVTYMDASTDMRINPENANRCFEIFLDESEEQTKRVIETQRLGKTLSGLQNEAIKEQIRQKHREAQRQLNPLKIIIPYIEHIEYPVKWLRARRDYFRFISLIECIAFLHQYQREQKVFTCKGLKPAPYIEATLSDYEIAYHLANRIIFNTLNELEKPVFNFFQELKGMVVTESKRQAIPEEEFWFTRRDVRNHVKMEDYLIKRYMKYLKDMEYFEVKGGNKGSRDVYRLSNPMQNQGMINGLTTPEELKQKIHLVSRTA